MVFFVAYLKEISSIGHTKPSKPCQLLADKASKKEEEKRHKEKKKQKY